MVGARLRRNKAKPRRRLLLIRAAVRGVLRSRRCPGVGRWGCGSPLVPWAVWGPLAPELHGALERPLAPGRHSSAKDMGGARAWRHPLLPSCASGPDGCGAVGAWQDLRAVHDSRVSDGKRGPSRQDLRAVYSQTAVCGAFRIHNAHILPKPAHFGYMAAKCCHEPALFLPEVPSGTHEAKKMPRLTAREHATAKSCHGSPPGNAPRRHLAAVGRGGTHFAIILPPASARNAR